MTAIPVQRRTQVFNLTEVWGRESLFSDWLVSDDGLAFLAEELGLVIANPRRESRPGSFPCDIVGELAGDPDHVVVIENQWGRTDHDHLGKMLTYAAVHRAMTAVWIAERVADDHRAVVDWLNANTPESVAFFLAEIKAFKIGASPAAPFLDVLCRPNYSTKSPSTPERAEWRRSFWSDIDDAMRKRHPNFKMPAATGSYWRAISVGRQGFNLEMLLTKKNGTVGLNLFMQPAGWTDDAFRQLHGQREAIEAELGVQLQWLPQEHRKSSKILWEVDLDPGDEANRSRIIEWFVANTPRFHSVFRDRVRQLVDPT